MVAAACAIAVALPAGLSAAASSSRKLNTAEIQAMMAGWTIQQYPEAGSDEGLPWVMDVSPDGSWSAFSEGTQDPRFGGTAEAWGSWRAENDKVCVTVDQVNGGGAVRPLSGCFDVFADEKKGDINFLDRERSKWPWVVARESFGAIASIQSVAAAAVAQRQSPAPAPAPAQAKETRPHENEARADKFAAAEKEIERQRLALQREKIELERARIAQEKAELERQIKEAAANAQAAAQNTAPAPSLVAPTPNLAAAPPADAGPVEYGQYHALVIGINDYTSLAKLKTALADARAVADMLRDNYGFNVRLLENPTRGQIINAFDRLREELIETDNLLIYYAGHGWLDREADRGYWLPKDARPDRRSNWLSVSDISDTLRAVLAKHVMIVADSCFSGTLTRNASPAIHRPDYLAKIATKKARVVLSSGGLEPVQDSGGGRHSVFAKQFLFELWDNHKIIDGTRLFQKVRRGVMLNADQQPQYSDIRKAGHEGGDFLFVRRN